MVSDFYVYEHWRADKGVCFYVGKGRGARHKNFAGRNIRHKRIRAKLRALGLEVEVRVIEKSLTEERAFSLEQERIALYPREQLANLTLGGGGNFGWKMSEVTKGRIAAAHRGMTHTPETRAKLSVINKGNRTWVGRKHSAESCLKMSITRTGRPGRPLKPEHLARLTAMKIGVPRAPEVRAKLSAANMGKKHSAETRAKMSASHRARLAACATREEQEMSSGG